MKQYAGTREAVTDVWQVWYKIECLITSYSFKVLKRRWRIICILRWAT